MAKINTKGALSGIVGPVSYRTQFKMITVQSRPSRVRQTPATKLSATEFGIANKAAKNIRHALFPILQDFSDNRMHSRFTAAVYKCLIGNTNLPKGIRTVADGDLQQLQHFQFNNSSPYADYAKVDAGILYNAAGGLTIHLPEFRPTDCFVKPQDATDCTLTFMVTAFDPETGGAVYAELHRHPVKLNNISVPASQWTAPALPPDHLVIVAAAAFYSRNNSLLGEISLNSKMLHPAVLLVAFKS